MDTWRTLTPEERAQARHTDTVENTIFGTFLISGFALVLPMVDHNHVQAMTDAPVRRVWLETHADMTLWSKAIVQYAGLGLALTGARKLTEYMSAKIRP